MQSAFIEIGLERAAFLHVADIWEERQHAQLSAAPAKPIERILSEGQSRLVQVIKDPIGTKGARLSTQISIAGRLVVYLPQDPHIGISQRVEDEIERALSRRVELKSGGYLILEQTEAMTTIDVNTGGYVGVRNFDDTIFKTNLEAAQVIARQLRLRNLGGIIIIDFIDMESAEHRSAVLAELNKALARDRTRN